MSVCVHKQAHSAMCVYLVSTVFYSNNGGDLAALFSVVSKFAEFWA